jgi:hypothetical protein
MATSSSILMDIFAIIILLSMFAHSVGIIGPAQQILLKTETFATYTHYEILDTYSDMGMTYSSKIPIPAGYTLELYDLNYAGSQRGKAYLVAAGVTNPTPAYLGNFNYESLLGNSHSTITGPGWIIVKTTPAGYVIIDYKEGSAVTTLMDQDSSRMPFVGEKLYGLGNAASDSLDDLFDEGY